MDDTVPPQSPEGRDRQVHAGFAKLRGQGWEYFMQKYDVCLGRNSKNSAVDVDLASHGGAMNISRRHARIFYNFESKRFEVAILGKNGAYIDGELRQPSDGPIELNSQSLIVIGDFPFYFLLPTKKIERAVRRRASDKNAGGGRAQAEEAESSSEDADHDTDNGEEVLDAPPPQPEEGDGPPKRKKHQQEESKEEQEDGDRGVVHAGEGQPKRLRMKVKKEGRGQHAEEPPAVATKHALPLKNEEGGSTQPVDEGKPSKKVKRDKARAEGDVEEQKPQKRKKLLAEKGGDAPESSHRGSKQEAGDEQDALPGSRKRKKKAAEADPPEDNALPEPVGIPGAASPKQRETHQGTPASPTRAGGKRAAAESAVAKERSHKKASKTQGGEASGVPKGAAAVERELVHALAEILGGQDQPPVVPLNKLFSAFTGRYPEVYDQSKKLLAEEAQVDNIEETPRPWLALASFLRRHSEQFLVRSLAKGKLTSLYASLKEDE